MRSGLANPSRNRHSAPKLLRFVIAQLDLDSGRRQGLFQAAFALKRTGTLSAADHDALEGILAWFGKNLQTSTRLTLSNRPGRQSQAICWFKDGANTHIAKIREYGLVLERHGLLMDELRTKRPGYIVYQDRHQVAAYPFADTPT
jgi:hypothetical protein